MRWRKNYTEVREQIAEDKRLATEIQGEHQRQRQNIEEDQDDQIAEDEEVARRLASIDSQVMSERSRERKKRMREMETSDQDLAERLEKLEMRSTGAKVSEWGRPRAVWKCNLIMMMMMTMGAGETDGDGAGQAGFHALHHPGAAEAARSRVGAACEQARTARGCTCHHLHC